MSLLTGKVTLVTGSSRVIGAAIATLFAQHGAKIAVHGRDRAAAQDVAERITKGGSVAIPVTADVTDFGAIERMRDEIEARLGPVDVLVANAGGNPTRPAPVETISAAPHCACRYSIAVRFLPPIGGVIRTAESVVHLTRPRTR